MEKTEKRMWMVTADLCKRCTAYMMKTWLDAMAVQALGQLTGLFPEKSYCRRTCLRENGDIVADIYCCGSTGAELPARDTAVSGLCCIARPYGEPDDKGMRDWAVRKDSIVLLSADEIRKYLYGQAVDAALLLSLVAGPGKALTIPASPDDVEEMEQGRLSVSVCCEGIEMAGIGPAPVPGKFDFTASLCGFDVRRFQSGRLTKDLRRLVAENPDMPVIVMTKNVWEYGKGENKLFCGSASARIIRYLAYNYAGDTTVLTSREQLEKCIRDELDEAGKKGEEFDRLLEEELERMEPCWEDAIAVDTGC